MPSSNACANMKTIKCLILSLFVTYNIAADERNYFPAKECDNGFMRMEFTSLTMSHIPLKQLVRKMGNGLLMS